MPNALAYLMLAIWPLVTVVLFRRMPLERAIIWTILGGYLVLPPVAMFDLPLVPNMTKVTIPNLSAFLVILVMLHKRVPLLPRNLAARLLALGFVLGVIPTVLTNAAPIVFHLLGQTEPIVFSTAQLPGLGLRDLFSVIINQFLILIPFLIARQYLASETGLRELLLALVVGGLIYALPALVEIRLSPQINVWVYGFFQHDFEQMMRDGGFRPIVFLPHGLWAAFFFMTAAVSAAALARASKNALRWQFLAAGAFLFGVLVLSKSLGSLVYALLLIPLVLVGHRSAQIRIVVVMVAVAVSYPVLRENGLVPLDRMLEQAQTISEARAQSLEYRFMNEERLLVRAQEKRLFGWGGYGRNLVRNVETGEIESIPDGEWIILFGTFGWLGYVSEMGLLALPLLVLWWRKKTWIAEPRAVYLAPLAILLGITMVDMLLNAIITPYTWLIAGALLGVVERLGRGEHDDPDAEAAPARPRTVFASRETPGPRTRL